ncbi:MAG: LCP family protein, partial [Actinomycetota bacterium]
EKHHIGLGLQRLNGRKALFYARYRGTEGGDLDRIERQQQLVSALREKALRWSTVKKMPEVLGILEEHVHTDLGAVEAVSLARALVGKGRDARMTTMRLEGTPATLEDGSQVLLPDHETNAAIIERFEDR